MCFRFADGATSSLIPLAVVLHYEMPLWALAVTTAAMNLAGVPAAFLWAKAMEGLGDRRSKVVAGYAVAATGLVLLAFLPSFPLFLLGAILYTAFGVATGPASSTVLLELTPRAEWSSATGRLSRLTGFSFLIGMGTVVAIGLTRGIHFHAVFAAAAVFALGAAVVASRTFPRTDRPAPADYDAGVVRAAQRWFERAVYFPGRLRHLPTLAGLRASLRGPHSLWPLGYALTFTGSVCFFTSYPGVLSGNLGLAAGVVLLCQTPSHIMTPLSYPAAGRFGARHGLARGVMAGSLVRTVALPLLCLSIVTVGAAAVPVIVVLHGLMGLSFALLQVNGPVLLAEQHPKGRAQGVGTYHAAVGFGTLCGSGLAYIILSVAPYQASYIAALAFALAGAFKLAAARKKDLPQAPKADAEVDAP